MNFIFIKIAILATLFCACNTKTSVGTPIKSDSTGIKSKMKGLNFVAPPQPFADNPMKPVKNLGANWIAVIPYGFTMPEKPLVVYNSNEWQWWGERPAGVRATIETAHAEGLHVMLKPQIYVPGSWTGGLDFATAADWDSWEQSYEAYLLPFARLADSLDVEILCVGTEFKIGARKREVFWRSLIKKVRNIYKGTLTYSANWDEYQEVPFWDALDAIGVSAYFPLIDHKTPLEETLQSAWQPYVVQLKTLSEQRKKPILFTEYGYMSVDGCAGKIWEVEQVATTLPINEAAQSNALAAMWAVFGAQPWWAGGFLWKWFPNMQGHEGYPERDYTPQGKAAERRLQQIWH